MDTPAWALLKDDRSANRFVVDLFEADRNDPFSHIRCPLCAWRPTPSSTWRCLSSGTPEPFFGGCGTTWNTFATRGRCPGCSHQWQWTSCLRCAQWSLHEDWYEETDQS
jgi:hypothetical protein